jgi:ribose-phosphate pyrophosphokinase
MPAADDPLLFAPDDSQLGSALAGQLKVALAPLESREFEDGEFKLRPLVSVRGRSVFVIQTLASSPSRSTAEGLVRLLFLLFTLRDGGAAQITALVPYLPYARKDRRTQPRDPIHTRYLAQLLEATRLDRLLTLDTHNPAAFDNAFRIGTDHLSALPLFVDHFARRLGTSNLVVVSPDVGGVKRAQIFRELLQVRAAAPVELAFLEKRRSGGTSVTGAVVGQVQDRRVLLIDDLCASGGTLLRAAEALRLAGALTVHAAVTHAPLARGVLALLASQHIADITLTDSVGAGLLPDEAVRSARVNVLPIAPLLATAIDRLRRGLPLSELLVHWPPEPL